MTALFPTPQNEQARLAALKLSGLLDSASEPKFDALTNLVASMFDVPICLISLLDENRQWFKSAYGMDTRETPREMAFCNYPVAENGGLIVEDAACDPRFASNPLVLGDPRMRFYAGFPIGDEGALNYGTLCIIDRTPRTLTDKQVSALKDAAILASSLIEQTNAARQAVIIAQKQADLLQKVQSQASHIQRQNNLFERASSLAKLGAWERDLASGEIIWSDGMYEIHETSRDFVPTMKSLQQFCPKSARGKLQKFLKVSSHAAAPYEIEMAMKTAKGNDKWVRLSSGVEFADGKPVRRFGIKQDITAQKELSAKTRLLASTDVLTGLNNRHVFEREVHNLATPGAAELPEVTVMLIDFDDFKNINDTYGHPAGDKCLMVLGRRLRRACRDAKVLARLGGDEFAVLLTGKAACSTSAKMAESLLEELQSPVSWKNKSFQISASIGIAERPAGSKPATISELLKEADLALYASKAAGRNTYRFFEPEMAAAARQKFDAITIARTAMKNNTLELFYQPKIRLSDGEVIGLEALLRCRGARGQILTPSAFFAAFDDFTLSARIGDFVLNKGLEQAAAWRARGLEFGHIAINVSASQFHACKLASQILDTLARHQLPPDLIQLEITENILLTRNADSIRRTLEELGKNGVVTAFDDFGTGFGSLTHLREFPVQSLKIDRSFVSAIDRRTDNQAIVKAMTTLGHNLGLTIVAEGIETASEKACVESIGCDHGQGYLFAKPEPADVVEDWLRNRAKMASARRPMMVSVHD